ncbi:MAG: zinc ribbon domain-containing protein [Phycisphaerales bacterium]
MSESTVQEGCMSVTHQLLGVFRVDKEISGLQSRLTSAERFLTEQTRKLAEIGAQADSLNTQIRQLKASIANAEGESERIKGHIDDLREKMNNSTSNKEYKALLSEVNNLKEQRSVFDEQAIEQLEKVDELGKQLEELEAAKHEREKMREVAEGDRQKRADEIAGKLAELREKRERLVTDVPKNAMSVYEELLESRGEDAMAPLEIIDRKRHEYVCSSSMMSVPVEVAASLIQGKLTLSPNDGCILYLTEEDEETLSGAFKK